MDFLGNPDPAAVLIALLGFVVAGTANVLWLSEYWSKVFPYGWSRRVRRPKSQRVPALRFSVTFEVGRAAVRNY